MKRILAAIALIFPLLAAASEFWSSPESLVRQFLVDYQAWNDAAFREDKKPGGDPGMKFAGDEYAKLLAKYAPPGFRGQPIAFGSQSSHSPEREKIVDVKAGKDKAVVKTQYRNPKALFIVHDYEYHLVRVGKRWYLREVYYVDEDGRYEGL